MLSIVLVSAIQMYLVFFQPNIFSEIHVNMSSLLKLTRFIKSRNLQIVRFNSTVVKKESIFFDTVCMCPFNPVLTSKEPKGTFQVYIA